MKPTFKKHSVHCKLFFFKKCNLIYNGIYCMAVKQEMHWDRNRASLPVYLYQFKCSCFHTVFQGTRLGPLESSSGISPMRKGVTMDKCHSHVTTVLLLQCSASSQRRPSFHSGRQGSPTGPLNSMHTWEHATG